ncbi:MAG: hypothetical protein JWR50_4352 [Mucilaginibacter sp.]|nr:hypothetical protein [Mucilaginibacter sp.]
MVHVIIDANVFKAIFEEDIGMDAPRPGRSGSATPVWIGNPPKRIAVMDAGGQIEAEWRRQVGGNSEWFDAWISTQMLEDRILTVTVTGHASTIKPLYSLGFPKGIVDIWYVRTAYEAKSTKAEIPAYLISEDIEFYDPKKKASKNKAELINSGKGPVAKEIGRNNVTVCCISRFLEMHPN